MTYNEYQAQLGTVSLNLSSNINRLILSSNSDAETKKLVQDVCKLIEEELKGIAILMSHSVRLGEED